MNPSGDSLSIGALVGLIVGLISIGGVIAAAGAALARLAALSQRVGSLEKSRENQGERIGALETRNAVIEHEVSRPFRTGLHTTTPRPRGKSTTPGEGGGEGESG